MRSVIGLAGAALSDAARVQTAVGKAGDLSVAEDKLLACAENSFASVTTDCACGKNKIRAASGKYCYKNPDCDQGSKCDAEVRTIQAQCNLNEYADQHINTVPCVCNAGDSNQREAQYKCGEGANTQKKRCYVGHKSVKFNDVKQQGCYDFGKCYTNNDNKLSVTMKRSNTNAPAFTNCYCNTQKCGATQYCLGEGNHNDESAGICSDYKYCKEDGRKALAEPCATGFLTIANENLNKEIDDPLVETCGKGQYWYNFNGVLGCNGFPMPDNEEFCGVCAHGKAKSSKLGCVGISKTQSTCESCDPNYILDTSKKECVRPTCTKATGCQTASTDDQCIVSGQEGCHTADKGYSLHSKPSRTTNNQVILNMCVCDNGIPVTAPGDCTSMKAHICKSCQDGFELVDKKCKRPKEGSTNDPYGNLPSSEKCDDHKKCSSGQCGASKTATLKHGDSCNTAALKDKCFSGVCQNPLGETGKEVCVGDGQCEGDAAYPKCRFGKSVKDAKGCTGGTCNPGFTLAGDKCEINKCKCEGGDAFGGDQEILCTGTGKQNCERCHWDTHYFQLLPSGERKCTANTCGCDNGAEAATGKDCTLNGANICKKCDAKGLYLLESKSQKLNPTTMNIEYSGGYCKDNCAPLGGGCSDGTPVNGIVPTQWDESNGNCCTGAQLSCKAAPFTKQGRGLVKVGFISKDEKGKEKYVLNSQLESETVKSCQTPEQTTRINYVLNQARSPGGTACVVDSTCSATATNCPSISCRSGLCVKATKKCTFPADQKDRAGDTCASSSDCQTGLFCNAEKKCATKIENGKVCTSGAVDAAASATCASGYCKSTDKQCTAKQTTAGGACQANDKDACSTGDGNCKGDSTCPKIADGQVCTTGAVDAAASATCDSGYCKSINKQCTAKQTTAGGPCQANDKDACSTGDGNCKADSQCPAAPVADGGVCAAATDTCAKAGQTCKVKSGASAGAVCANDAACNNNDCPAAAGAAATKSCTTDRDCLSNSCTGTAGSKTCAAGADVKTCGAGAAVKTCQV